MTQISSILIDSIPGCVSDMREALSGYDREADKAEGLPPDGVLTEDNFQYLKLTHPGELGAFKSISDFKRYAETYVDSQRCTEACLAERPATNDPASCEPEANQGQPFTQDAGVTSMDEVLGKVSSAGKINFSTYEAVESRSLDEMVDGESSAGSSNKPPTTRQKAAKALGDYAASSGGISPMPMPGSTAPGAPPNSSMGSAPNILAGVAFGLALILDPVNTLKSYMQQVDAANANGWSGTVSDENNRLKNGTNSINLEH